MAEPYSMFNTRMRIQQDFTMLHAFPLIPGKCSCGCGVELTGRQTRWSSTKCNDNAYQQYAIKKGYSGAIRKAVHERDKGFCCNCGVKDYEWQADHIIPVKDGGGACGLDNFQTLCLICHKDKTRRQANLET